MDLDLRLYKKIYLIRCAEDKIRKHYREGMMKTPMHMSTGEEGICGGVIAALNKKDQVCCTYRSHGVYLSKTEETDKFFSELLGKRNGTSRGKSGSMHLMAPDDGLVCTSAIVAGHIPVAVGIAHANIILDNKQISTVFFGDGAVDEGVFWESLNFACLMKLPVLFVLEDNDLAVHTRKSQRHGYSDLNQIVSKFDCAVFESSSADAEEIYFLVKQVIDCMKSKRCPAFLSLKYFRYLQHVGVGNDVDTGFRPTSEYKDSLESDPIEILRNKLIQRGKSEMLADVEGLVHRQVDDSYLRALKSEFPSKAELFDGVLQ